MGLDWHITRIWIASKRVSRASSQDMAERDEAATDTGFAWFKPGIKISIDLFCDEMGLAPAESGKKSTIPPCHYGMFP